MVHYEISISLVRKNKKRGGGRTGITPNTPICGKTDTCITFVPLSDCNGIADIIWSMVWDALGVSLVN